MKLHNGIIKTKEAVPVEGKQHHRNKPSGSWFPDPG